MVIDSITNYYIYLESAFYLKKQSLLNPNPVEVIRVFPVALRNFKIFRFLAKNEKNDQEKIPYLYIQFCGLFNIDSKYIYFLLAKTNYIGDITGLVFFTFGRYRGKNLEVSLFAQREVGLENELYISLYISYKINEYPDFF